MNHHALLATLLVAALLRAGTALAVPARPVLSRVQQPDGTTLSLRLVGDEYLNYHTTADGYTVVADRQGRYVYAQPGADGQLAPTAILAHDASRRNADELSLLARLGQNVRPHMSQRRLAARQAENARRAATLAQRRQRMAARRRTAAYNPDNFRGLVILVEYNDCHFQRDDYAQLMDSMLNQRGYGGYTSYDASGQAHQEVYTGSVRDYFVDNTMGQMDPQFDVVGPVRVARSQYYVEQDAHAATLFREALAAADSLADYSRYDGDGDGLVDLVYFIVAGVGSHNSGNDQRLLWPHASSISPVAYDGVSVSRYACSTELLGFAGSTLLDGIGTICHEFTHVLGLMDLYDTDGAASGGQSLTPGSWSLMAQGGYLNSSRTPCGYTLYERYAMGFAVPQPLDTEGHYQLESLSASNTGYRLDADRPSEYFLLENRQRDKWNAYLPGHGLMVYHVDSTDVAAWEGNRINVNPAHNNFMLLRAGGNHGDSGSDPFPGTTDATELTNYTTATLKAWSGEDSPLVLTAIDETDGRVSFSVQAPQAYDFVDGFETAEAVGQEGNYPLLSGPYCQWVLIGSELSQPGSTLCNGTQAIAMPANSVLRTTPMDQPLRRLMVTLFNPTTSAVRIEAACRPEGQTQWTSLTPQNANAADGVAAGESGVLVFAVAADAPARYQFVRRSGTTAVYLDDVTFVFDGDDPSAISSMTVPSPSAQTVYDLQGRRVNTSQLRPGIYLVGGRKQVVK